jgi:hypothetical protein
MFLKKMIIMQILIQICNIPKISHKKIITIINITMVEIKIMAQETFQKIDTIIITKGKIIIIIIITIIKTIIIIADITKETIIRIITTIIITTI